MGDLGTVAAELIRVCLQKRSFDNMTALIAHFVDGSDWQCHPDEVLDYEALAIGAVPPGDSRHQHLAMMTVLMMALLLMMMMRRRRLVLMTTTKRAVVVIAL